MKDTKVSNTLLKTAVCVAVPCAIVGFLNMMSTLLDKDSKNIQIEFDLRALRFSLATS